MLARKQGLLKVLDFGTFDGSLLSTLDASQFLSSGLGVDVNAEAIESGAVTPSPRVSLRTISKGEPIPLDADSVDAVTLIGVIEHVHDQDRLLRDIHRVLKIGGVLIVAVPGQHLFSFLDLGNLKFRFPRLHQRFYVWRHGLSSYNSRYVNTRTGLIGDIEIEKGWHEHFTLSSLYKLLEKNGFAIRETDGMGYFYRVIHNVYWMSPVFKNALDTLMRRDLRKYEKAELFVLCVKSD